MNKKQFPYNNFIGEHMKNGLLKVKIDDLVDVRELNGYDNINGLIFQYCKPINPKYCKPQVIDPKSLTDEEFIYLFFGDNKDRKSIEIECERTDDSVCFFQNDNEIFEYSFDEDMMLGNIPFGLAEYQQILNRMYSCFTLPDFEYFKQNGVIDVVDGGFYE
jgi:hypothetical protein